MGLEGWLGSSLVRLVSRFMGFRVCTQYDVEIEKAMV